MSDAQDIVETGIEASASMHEQSTFKAQYKDCETCNAAHRLEPLCTQTTLSIDTTPVLQHSGNSASQVQQQCQHGQKSTPALHRKGRV